MTTGLHLVALEPAALGLATADAERTVHLGRSCLRFAEGFLSPTVPEESSTMSRPRPKLR